MKIKQLIPLSILLCTSVGALANGVTIINQSKVPLTLQYKEAYKNPGHSAKVRNTSVITLNADSSRTIDLQTAQYRDSGVVVTSMQVPMTGEWVNLPKTRTQFEGLPGCWASSNKTDKIRVKLIQKPGGHGTLTCNTRP